MIEITTFRWTTFRFTCDYCWCRNRVDVDAWTHAVQVVKSSAYMRRTVQCSHCAKAHTIEVTRADVGVVRG